MSIRHSLALNLTPLLLRLGLAVVFLWAGSSKLFYSDVVTGERAALLANLGAITPSKGTGLPVTPPDAPVESGAPTPSAPEATPEPSPASQPSAEPAAPPTKPAEAKPTEAKPAESAPPAGGAPGGAAPVNPAQPASPRAGAFETPRARSGGMFILAAAPAAPVKIEPSGTPASQPPLVIDPSMPAPRYTASDFPGTVKVSRVYGLAALLHGSSQPDAQGNALWPASLSSPLMLRTMAWVAVLTEFFGGAFVLFGFLTRLWSLALAGTMATAMLLTTVGPAVMSGSGFLGFLPDPQLANSQAWVGAWTPMLFQFSLFLMGLSLALTGPGVLSVDHLIFRARPNGAGSKGGGGPKRGPDGAAKA